MEKKIIAEELINRVLVRGEKFYEEFGEKEAMIVTEAIIRDLEIDDALVIEKYEEYKEEKEQEREELLNLKNNKPF